VKSDRASLSSLPLSLRYIIALVFLAVLVVVAYFAQKNISADTARTPKIGAKISVTNWDGDDKTAGTNGNNQASYFKYVDDQEYRCDTVSIYFDKLNNVSASSSDADKIKNNRDSISNAVREIASLNGLTAFDSITTAINYYNGLKDGATDQEIGEGLKKTIVYPSTGTECTGSGSVSYAVTLKIPDKYLQGFVTGSTSTSTPAPSLASSAGTATKKCFSNQDASGKTIYYLFEKNGTVWSSKTTADTLNDAKITSGETSPYISQSDLSLCNNSATSSPSPSPTSSAGTTSSNQKINIKKISVYKRTADNNGETPVKYATVIGTYKNKDGKELTISGLNSQGTGDKNYAENIIFDKPSDSVDTNGLTIVAKKRQSSGGKITNDTLVSSAIEILPFRNADEIKLYFASDAKIDPDVIDTSTAQPPSGTNVPATSSDFPAGNNTIIFTAVRASMAAGNGWTPVGGTAYKLEVQVSGSSSTSPATAIAPTAKNGSLPYSNIVKNDSNNGFIQRVTSWAKGVVGATSMHSASGLLADNGTSTKLTLQSMPAGIYTVELSKNNFSNAKFTFEIPASSNGSTYDLGGLPITPQTGAEPPSIESIAIVGAGNSDFYKAANVNGTDYLYSPRGPWKGWQKMIAGANNYGYDFTKPTIDGNGLPSFNGNGSSSNSPSWMGGTANEQSMANQFQRCVSSQSQTQLGVSGKLGDILAGLGIASFLDTSTGPRTLEKAVKQVALTVGIPYLIDSIAGTDIKGAQSSFSLSLDPIFQKCMYIIYGTNLSTTPWSIPSECSICYNTGSAWLTRSTNLVGSTVSSSLYNTCTQCEQNNPQLKYLRSFISGGT